MQEEEGGKSWGSRQSQLTQGGESQKMLSFVKLIGEF